MNDFQRKNGDRNSLSFDQRDLLENQVLPTAREWLKIPELRAHGAQTLEFWGENVPTHGG